MENVVGNNAGNKNSYQGKIEAKEEEKVGERPFIINNHL